MYIHPAFVVFHCLLTVSVVLTIALGIGKFFCIEFMENIWDSIAEGFDGVPFILSTVSAFCLIGVWLGYIYEIEALYAIALLFTGVCGVLYWLFALYILVDEVIAPVIRNWHYTIRVRKNGRY